MATYVKNQLSMVPLAELQPDPTQPRKYMDPTALDELTASVAQMGIIQPVVCRQDPAMGLVYTVAGERRCAAARKAGLATVPAVFIDSANYAEIALVENLLRQDLNPVEEAEALQRLMDDHAYQQEELAKIIGKSQPTISESLSLNKLPKEIRDECRQGDRRCHCSDTTEADQDGGHRQQHRHDGEQNRRPGISRLLRGGPSHDYRDHDLHERHPRRGHHPGSKKQEKTDLKMIGDVGIVLMTSHR